MTRNPLRIAIALHDFPPLHERAGRALTQPPYIQQAGLASNLQTLGRTLTCLGVPRHGRIVVAVGPRNPQPAPRSWTDRRRFTLARGGVWKLGAQSGALRSVARRQSVARHGWDARALRLQELCCDVLDFRGLKVHS